MFNDDIEALDVCGTDCRTISGDFVLFYSQLNCLNSPRSKHFFFAVNQVSRKTNGIMKSKKKKKMHKRCKDAESVDILGEFFYNTIAQNNCSQRTLYSDKYLFSLLITGDYVGS